MEEEEEQLTQLCGAAAENAEIIHDFLIDSAVNALQEAAASFFRQKMSACHSITVPDSRLNSSSYLHFIWHSAAVKTCRFSMYVSPTIDSVFNVIIY